MEQRGGDQKVERGEVVVDASVVIKWFVEEEYSREARLLRDTYANGLVDLAAFFSREFPWVPWQATEAGPAKPPRMLFL